LPTSLLGASAPEKAVIVLPKEQTEAWLLAVHTKLKDVEAEPNPRAVLVDRGILPLVEKERTTAVYAMLAAPLAQFISDAKRLRAVTELARFVGKLQRYKLGIALAAKKKGKA
jgi:hypothetical protein